MLRVKGVYLTDLPFLPQTWLSLSFFSCFVLQRCWDVALGPLKQIPMNLFIMYMSGNTISIFPIMMVCMMAWRPIQALMSMSASECSVLRLSAGSTLNPCSSLTHWLCRPDRSAFKLLESSSQQWLQGLVYLIGNLLGAALAIYKCQSMGLLPTHSSDWLAFIEPPQVTSQIHTGDDRRHLPKEAFQMIQMLPCRNNKWWRGVCSRTSQAGFYSHNS